MNQQVLAVRLKSARFHTPNRFRAPEFGGEICQEIYGGLRFVGGPDLILSLKLRAPEQISLCSSNFRLKFRCGVGHSPSHCYGKSTTH